MSDWRQLLRNQEIETEKRITDAYNLGMFFKYVKNRVGHRSNIGALVSDQGQIIIDDVD